jgi:small subunit ribosomal protein S16
VAVKLRLVRMGKKKQPTYRIVAADSRRARGGAFLEIVGTYQPRGVSAANPDMVFNIDNDKCVHWLQHGAQPSDRVAKLLKASGALDAFEASKSGAPTSAVATEPAAAVTAPAVTTTESDAAAEAEAQDAESTDQ